jgi:hypothetical protein
MLRRCLPALRFTLFAMFFAARHIPPRRRHAPSAEQHVKEQNRAGAEQNTEKQKEMQSNRMQNA